MTPQLNKGPALKCLAEIIAFIDGWLSAFGECDDIKRWIGLPMSNLGQLLNQFGVSYDEAAAAIEPWMGFEPSDYALGH